MTTPTPTSSSVIASHAYDPQTRNLTVEFRSGAKHVYRDVPMEKAEALSGNASPGRYFGAKIRGAYRSRRVG